MEGEYTRFENESEEINTQSQPHGNSENEIVISNKFVPWTPMWLSIITGILAIFFLLYTILVQAIPNSQYKKAKSKYPNATFLVVPAEYDAVHYITGLSLVLLFSFVCSTRFINYSCPQSIFVLTLFFSLTNIGIYCFSITTMCDAVKIGLNPHTNYSSYLSSINQMISENPSMVFTSSGSYSYDSNTFECVINRYSYRANFSNDSTIINDFGEDSFFSKVFLSVNWSETAKNYFDGISEMLNEMIPKEFNGNEINWKLEKQNQIKSYIDITLVEKKINSKISRKTGITMIALMSGIGYAYRVASVPIFEQEIIKNNVQLVVNKIPNVEDEFWYNFQQSLKCFELN